MLHYVLLCHVRFPWWLLRAHSIGSQDYKEYMLTGEGSQIFQTEVHRLHVESLGWEVTGHRWAILWVTKNEMDKCMEFNEM